MKLKYLIIALFMATTLSAEGKVALVNFKKAVESSKIGKFEQENFEKTKKQMESIIGDKEKRFNAIAEKRSDEDYRDSLKPEALEELDTEFRTLGQELAQAQQQFYQVLQQANYKIVQKLMGDVSEAAQVVAKEEGFDIVQNTEGLFYFDPKLEITDAVVAEMDSAMTKKDETVTDDNTEAAE